MIQVDQIGGGPDFHGWPVTARNDSLCWENLNRAKKSVALDLRRVEGRALLQQLVVETGQFVTNFPFDSFLAHAPLAARRADLATIPQVDRQPPLPAPRNGEDSEQVLADRLGLPSIQIAHLINAGIVGIPATRS